MRIGIIGGGQLCQMMAIEIEKKGLGHEIIAIDPTLDCPAKPYIKEQIVADFKNEEKIRELAKKVDVITFEIELANSHVLKEIEKSGKIIAPSPESLYTIQNKFRQKTFLKEKKLPVPEFLEINSKQDLIKGLEKFGYPSILKATEDSYDGRGNFVIKNKEDIDRGFEFFKNRHLMLEKIVNFKKEISIMAARSLKGEIKTYEPSENIHKDNILYMTIAPAKISKEISKKAQDVAINTMQAFNGAGVFGIEMFIDENDNILINEIAPRVHNSGHHTIEACKTSQFEQHIRAITGMELGDTQIINSAIMCNILGEKDKNGKYELVIENDFPNNAFIHMYEKHETKPARKMGHVTILTNSVEEAQKVREKISLKIKNV